MPQRFILLCWRHSCCAATLALLYGLALVQIVSGLLAGITGLSVAKQAQANIDLIDDRKVRDRGFDLIYEARDVDLPQAQRDGFTQVRSHTTCSSPPLPSTGPQVATALMCIWLQFTCTQCNFRERP